MTQILIVEDEIKIAKLLQDYCHKEGFTASIISDGALVETWLAANECHAIILDIMLPNVDGITLCKNIRAYSNVPILMLSAKTEEIDRLLGLERSEEHTSELQSRPHLVCRLLLEKKNK